MNFAEFRNLMTILTFLVFFANTELVYVVAIFIFACTKERINHLPWHENFHFKNRDSIRIETLTFHRQFKEKERIHTFLAPAGWR